LNLAKYILVFVNDSGKKVVRRVHKGARKEVVTEMGLLKGLLRGVSDGKQTKLEAAEPADKGKFVEPPLTRSSNMGARTQRYSSHMALVKQISDIYLAARTRKPGSQTRRR